MALQALTFRINTTETFLSRVHSLRTFWLTCSWILMIGCYRWSKMERRDIRWSHKSCVATGHGQGRSYMMTYWKPYPVGTMYNCSYCHHTLRLFSNSPRVFQWERGIVDWMCGFYFIIKWIPEQTRYFQFNIQVPSYNRRARDKNITVY